MGVYKTEIDLFITGLSYSGITLGVGSYANAPGNGCTRFSYTTYCFNRTVFQEYLAILTGDEIKAFMDFQNDRDVHLLPQPPFSCG